MKRKLPSDGEGLLVMMMWIVVSSGEGTCSKGHGNKKGVGFGVEAPFKGRFNAKVGSLMERGVP